MLTWNELQATLNPYVELYSTSVLLLALAGLLSLSFFNLYAPYDVPGPSFWHIFPNGEIYPLIRDSRTTSQTLLNLAEKHGEVFQAWLGIRRMVVSSNPTDVAQIMTAIEDFVRPEETMSTVRTILPGGLLTMPKEIHMAARKTLKDKFNSSMLDYFHSFLSDAIAELCEELTAKAKQNGADELAKAVDISPTISTASFRVIAGIAFGSDMSRKKRIEFYGWVEQILEEVLKDFLGYPFRQGLTVLGVRNRLFEAKSNLYSLCKEFISRRLEETPDEKDSRPMDALDAIISVGRNNLQTVTSLTVELTVAGSHTISQTVSWCIYELCCDRRVEAEVQREIDTCFSSRPLSEPVIPEDVRGMVYLNKVWKETLRLHPPLGLIMRQTSRDLVLRGSQVELRKGAHVMAFLHGVQTSPKIWRDPKKFMPERWGSGAERGEGDKVPRGAYAPFSMGQKSCLGKFLADYEGILILAELYRRFKFTLACAPTEIVSCTMWLDGPRYASVKGGEFDMGVPVQIQLRT